MRLIILSTNLIKLPHYQKIEHAWCLFPDASEFYRIWVILINFNGCVSVFINSQIFPTSDLQRNTRLRNVKILGFSWWFLYSNISLVLLWLDISYWKIDFSIANILIENYFAHEIMISTLIQLIYFIYFFNDDWYLIYFRSSTC